jgi:hypothetical protein
MGRLSARHELAVELRERNHRALELASENLKTRDLGDLDLAVLGTPRCVGVMSWR